MKERERGTERGREMARIVFVTRSSRSRAFNPCCDVLRADGRAGISSGLAGVRDCVLGGV